MRGTRARRKATATAVDISEAPMIGRIAELSANSRMKPIDAAGTSRAAITSTTTADGVTGLR